MAHLRPGDRASDPDAGRDRAQLLLITGFVLAVVFVAFAFLLNSVIYTENLATRGEGAGTTHAVAITNDVATGTEAVVAYANEHNTSRYGSLDNELKSGLADIERLMGTQQLAGGGVVQVGYVSYRNGTWVDQSYQEGNFTDADGGKNWTLFDGSDGVRSFRIHVTDPDRLENVVDLSGISLTNFTVKASDGTDTWTMEVYHDRNQTGEPYVAEITDGNGNTRYCTVDDDSPFWINVSAGTVAGEECAGLEFGENISTVETVEFENGKSVYGTYRLMAAKEKGTGWSSAYNSTGGPPPVRRPAIYNATIHVAYDTERLHYETDRTVELKREGDDA